MPVDIVRPGYPPDGLKDGVSGDVLVSLVVRKDGTAWSIVVEEGIAGYPSFADSTIAAVSQWTFRAAKRNGEEVETTIRIPVRFALDDEK